MKTEAGDLNLNHGDGDIVVSVSGVYHRFPTKRKANAFAKTLRPGSYVIRQVVKAFRAPQEQHRV
jgi:hypothetical protein